MAMNLSKPALLPRDLLYSAFPGQMLGELAKTRSKAFNRVYIGPADRRTAQLQPDIYFIVPRRLTTHFSIGGTNGWGWSRSTAAHGLYPLSIYTYPHCQR